MARPLRIEYSGAFYHVTSRGNERKDVFKSKTDREKYLSYLATATERYDARIHVYCLMSNHYHLLLETPSGNLSQIMRHINGAYTTYFNSKRQRSGHLFQGRYKAILVDADEYATHLSRYIHLNPVRAGLVSIPEDYLWSSYQYFISRKKPPPWLILDFVLSFFSNKKSIARKRYREFVSALVEQEYESPLKDVFASTILGSLDFVKDIQEKYLTAAKNDRNVPALTELSRRKTLKEIHAVVEAEFDNNQQMARKAALYICHRYSGRKLKEIGEYFSVGESAVSQTSRRFSAMLVKDKKLQKRIEKIGQDAGLSNV